MFALEVKDLFLEILFAVFCGIFHQYTKRYAEENRAAIKVIAEAAIDIAQIVFCKDILMWQSL